MLYNFNMNYPDEAWQKVFRDVRFRRAMSVAINRDEINEVLFFGMGTPAQLTAHRPRGRTRTSTRRPGRSTTRSWRTSCWTRWA